MLLTVKGEGVAFAFKHSSAPTVTGACQTRLPESAIRCTRLNLTERTSRAIATRRRVSKCRNRLWFLGQCECEATNRESKIAELRLSYLPDRTR